MSAGKLALCGILKPEIMLQQAQAEIDELKQKVVLLERSVTFQSAVIASLCARAGGEVFVTDDELAIPKAIGQQRDKTRGIWKLIGRVVNDGQA